MRVGTAVTVGREHVVVERDGVLFPLDVPPGVGLVDLIAARAVPDAAPGTPPLPGARLAAPLRPGKVVAIGLNYLDHVRETGMEAPARPLVFAKWPTSVIGPGEAIVIDEELTERVDWEVELAAVIGTTARDVPAERALEHVLGYTVGNDVSARDVQFADGQWVRGKSFDTFCPLGPAIV